MTKSECLPPVEPRLDDWCTEKRLRQLCDDLHAARESILWSGHLNQVLQGWVRRELVKEVLSDGSLSSAFEHESSEPCPSEWPSSLHQAWMMQDQALLAWAELHWGQGLNSIYLARKSELDRVSLRMLRVSDAGMSMELYHRIKAEEASFEQLSWQYGEGAERLKGGLIKNQRLVDLPPAFFPLLVNLHTFEVQQPRAIGKHFVLYQLLSRRPLVFDQETRCQLLMEQLQCWEAPLVERLGAHLASQS